MDLRLEFGKLIDEFGWPVLYQRGNRKLRCKCYNSRYQEADAHCPICNGSGWIIRLERQMVRGEGAMQTVTYPNLNQASDIGRSWVPAELFFMYNTANPKVGDVILEVGWKGSRPTNVRTVYEINHVEPLRGDNGRVEFWEAYVKAEPFDNQKYKIAIKQYGNQLVYEMPGS